MKLAWEVDLRGSTAALTQLETPVYNQRTNIMGFEDTSSTEVNTETSNVTKQNEKIEVGISITNCYWKILNIGGSERRSEPSNDESDYEETPFLNYSPKRFLKGADEDDDYNFSQETLRYFDLKANVNF